MQIKELFTDDDAVSPVIGVILMVAITVILAAVIGTFVLGLGDEVQTTAPNAQFSFDQDGAAGDSGSTLDITHDGGDEISADELTVTVAGTEAGYTQWDGSYSDVSAGKSITLDISGDSEDDTVRVVWEASSGDSSQILADYDLN